MFSVLPGFKQRVSLIAIAVLAALAMAPILDDEARAASGAVSATTSDGTDGGRQTTAYRYRRIWEQRISRREKRWAYRTAQCESGGNPRAIGGGGLYRGAFQFMKSTWRTSPKSPGGDPIRYTYRTQAVVAIMLKRRDGAGHWPVCG